VLREVSPRTLDVVAAAGELVSSRIIAAALTAAGIPSEWVDARRAIITNGDHTRAVPLAAETEAALRSTVLAEIDAGRVPVLGGFVDRPSTATRRRWAAAGRITRAQSSAPASAPARFKSGPMWTAC